VNGLWWECENGSWSRTWVRECWCVKWVESLSLDEWIDVTEHTCERSVYMYNVFKFWMKMLCLNSLFWQIWCSNSLLWLFLTQCDNSFKCQDFFESLNQFIIIHYEVIWYVFPPFLYNCHFWIKNLLLINCHF
jgi:hypothetical protein